MCFKITKFNQGLQTGRALRSQKSTFTVEHSRIRCHIEGSSNCPPHLFFILTQNTFLPTFQSKSFLFIILNPFSCVETKKIIKALYIKMALSQRRGLATVFTLLWWVRIQLGYGILIAQKQKHFVAIQIAGRRGQQYLYDI